MPLKYLLTFSFNNIIIIIILQNASEFHDIGVDTKIGANLNFFFFFFLKKKIQIIHKCAHLILSGDNFIYVIYLEYLMDYVFIFYYYPFYALFESLFKLVPINL